MWGSISRNVKCWSDVFWNFKKDMKSKLSSSSHTLTKKANALVSWKSGVMLWTWYPKYWYRLYRYVRTILLRIGTLMYGRDNFTLEEQETIEWIRSLK